MAGKPHPQEHGNMKGYRQHYKRKQSPCQPCKDARAAHMRQYRKDNPEIMKASNKRRWERADKELARLSALAWRHNNRDHANAYQRNLRKDNPRFLELHNATSRRRRARIRNQGFEFFTETDVLNAYGSDCHLCSKAIDLNAPRHAMFGTNWENGLHIDHIVPIAKGGPDILDNVRPAHAFCNLSKGSKFPGYQAKLS
jgi:5-methylcytosine-specific restriction endonuclease McrA